MLLLFFLLFKRFYLFIFRERGREGGREGEKHQCVVASHTPRTGDLAHNPGMCPDWESNQWSSGSQAGIQSTERHQPGLLLFFLAWSFHLQGYFIITKLLLKHHPLNFYFKQWKKESGRAKSRILVAEPACWKDTSKSPTQQLCLYLIGHPSM